MKLVSEIARDYSESLKEDKPKLCEYVMSPNGCLPLKSPILSTEHECEWCGGTAHYSPLVDPTQSAARTWLCANTLCAVYIKRSAVKASQPMAKPSRAILWPKFCEINDIGDVHYEVKFESIEQTQGKISYMLKFVDAPRGIIIMQGEPGTGKTYAAMAICELYTRKDSSAIFTTQKQMSNKWLETFKAERYSNYIERVTSVSVLVIDDFGTAEMPPGFMSFFMDLINTRLQWTTRGTVITSNLDAKSFSKACGDALSDRLNTGQWFEFKGKTRRKQIVL